MINSLSRQHKGFASLLFIFIFLYSGILRGVITTDVIDYVSNYAQHDSETKSTFSAQQNHFNGFSIANQNKEKSESETDEAHFNFQFSFSSHSPFIFLPYPKLSGSFEVNRINTLKQPLYDLFCNWKFHLI